MSTELQVAAWTPVIVKGGVFQKTLSLTDEDGTPISLTSAQIDVNPDNSAAFSWTQANGKFTLVSTGVYSLDLTAADTTALDWTTGVYRLNVVDGSGDENPCLIEGRVFVKDC